MTHASAWGAGLHDRGRRRHDARRLVPLARLGRARRPTRRRRSTSPSPAATARDAVRARRRCARSASRSTSTPPPTSAADVYLRLHLLSHRLAAPRSINLDGVFGLLTTVAWTDLGPVAAGRPRRRPAGRARPRVAR